MAPSVPFTGMPLGMDEVAAIAKVLRLTNHGKPPRFGAELSGLPAHLWFTKVQQKIEY